MSDKNKYITNEQFEQAMNEANINTDFFIIIIMALSIRSC